MMSLFLLGFSSMFQVNNLCAQALNDNFDSYNDGDLNGQGGWSGPANYDVQGVTTYGGTTKAVHTIASGGTTVIEKSVTKVVDGSQIAFHNPHTDFAGKGTFIQFYEGADFISNVGFDAGNIYLYWDDSGRQSDKIGEYDLYTWYKVEVEWNATANQVRARIDDGTWSDWKSSDAFGGIDTISMAETQAEGYWDEFESQPSPIPTLSEWGMIIFMTLMMGIGVMILRKRRIV